MRVLTHLNKSKGKVNLSENMFNAPLLQPSTDSASGCLGSNCIVESCHHRNVLVLDFSRAQCYMMPGFNRSKKLNMVCQCVFFL